MIDSFRPARRIVKKGDVEKAQSVIVNKMLKKKFTKKKHSVEVEAVGGGTVPVKQMTELDMMNILKSESTRAAFVLGLAQMGVNLQALGEAAQRGLHAWKRNKAGDEDPDFVAQNMWFRSIIDLYGMTGQNINAATAIPGESVKNFADMTEEELELELKKQLGRS